ncbi:S1-like domain-containing RNA-binding protein [Catenibacillus scindens]|uniref:CvfB family protein n=1 Tax=Catenibacillus scindens TaxID=673271 RepID=UPI003209FC2C
MIRLGEKQILTVTRMKDFGVYLANEADNSEEAVLLPKKEVPQNTQVGTQLEVFIYRDSSDRLIATTATPKILLGKTAPLLVKQVTKIGAFLDWGLPKDLLLPFKEQITRVKEGEEYLVALYIDKSSRLCATMKVYQYLDTHSPYEKEDHAQGYIYQIHPEYGAFVAVDGMYHGLIPLREFKGRYSLGEKVHVRIVRVRDDGRLELSLHEKIPFQIDLDAAKVMEVIESYAGVLPFTEKASPAVVERETGLSKAAFKRAVGRLLRNGKITIENGVIRKIKD